MQEQLISYGVEFIKQNTELTLGASCVLMSFSFAVRTAIRRRDGKCTNEGARHCGQLEAAHYDHDKSNPNYDSMDNGRTLCTNCHLQDHIERAGENGLSEAHNNNAIGALVARLRDAVNYREDTK